MSTLNGFHIALQKWREYDAIADISQIARRYFAMNAFDGVLTIMGVLIGNYAAGVDEPRVVVSTGLATCVAMGVSGLWGAYLTESAERRREIEELERATLSKQSGTKIGRASRLASIVVAVIDGLSPFTAALFVLAPFFLCNLWGDVRLSYLASLAVAMASLFGLGAFLGRIGRENIVRYGLRTVAAGGVCLLINLVLGAH